MNQIKLPGSLPNSFQVVTWNVCDDTSARRRIKAILFVLAFASLATCSISEIYAQSRKPKSAKPPSSRPQTIKPLSKEQLNEALFSALEKQDQGALLSLLKRGANPNATKSGLSALSWSLRKSADANSIENISEKIKVLTGECALILLEAGANPNGAGDKNDIPLIFATQSLSEEVCKELIKKGAKINVAPEHSLSPLC